MEEPGITSPNKENFAPNLAALSESLKLGIPPSPKPKRGQWFSPCNSPRKPNTPDGDLPTLNLTHFAKTPRVGFGNVRMGSSKSEELVVWNPNTESQTLRIEKLPSDRGFMVDLTDFKRDEQGNDVLSVGPEDEVSLKITWEPKESGRCRELIVFKWEETHRLLAIMFGTAVDTTKKRKSSVLGPSQSLNKSRARWSTNKSRFSVVTKDNKPNAVSPLRQPQLRDVKTTKTNDNVLVATKDTIPNDDVLVAMKGTIPNGTSPLRQPQFGSVQIPVNDENVAGENTPEIRRETYVLPVGTPKGKPLISKSSPLAKADKAVFTISPLTSRNNSKVRVERVEKAGTAGSRSQSTDLIIAHLISKQAKQPVGLVDKISKSTKSKKAENSKVLTVAKNLKTATEKHGGVSKSEKTAHENKKVEETKITKPVPQSVAFSVHPQKKPAKQKMKATQRPHKQPITGKGSAPLKKTHRVKYKVASKGVAPTKLKLAKPPKTSIPRHPMPFAAKNMYYDERWIDKQEEGFTRWLNFVLTPPDDCEVQVQKDKKVDCGTMSVTGTQSMKSTQPLAPTKEDLSFRSYTARRRMARLRRCACILYQSEPLVRIIRKIEAEVEQGRLAIRPDRKMHADLGIKQTVVNMMLSYNTLWLRIGLETIYGEILPIQNNNDTAGLARFLTDRLLGNPDIARAYAHPTVPGLYRDGYILQLSRFTLKKFLLVVLFLDHAKLTRLIDHDPCLFNKNADYKANRDLLLTFSRDYLKGEGDLTKHLSYLGYNVSHQQRAIDEFDYAVTKIATDLRDGLRLTRVVELLTHNWQLTSNLRVPAISRLQKIHNVEVFMKALKDHGIPIGEGEENDINPRDIVDGHREKTLNLLWMVIFHFQVNILLSEQQLKDEISFLEKTSDLELRLASCDMSRMLGLPRNKRESLENNVYFKSERLSLLLKWCRLVCKMYGLKIENFTVSFSDGRALCYLLHHYHPSLLPLNMIHQDTTLTRNPGVLDSSDSEGEEGIFRDSWAANYSPGSGTNHEIERLKANERENFKVLSEKVQALGGVPLMTRFADMSNTIPDEKVVITYTSYMCARLLDLRDETRAARCIQMAWKKYRLRKQLERNQDMSRSTVFIQALARGAITRRRYLSLKRAAVQLQAAYRGHLIRREMKSRDLAARRIQSCYRTSKVTCQQRAEYLRFRKCVISLQAVVRSNQARKLVVKIRAARIIQAAWKGYTARARYCEIMSAVVKCQAAIRGYLARKRFLSMRKSALVLQDRYRAVLKQREVRSGYLTLREAVIVFQAVFRGRLGRASIRSIRAAIVIQSVFRMRRQRTNYIKLRESTITIQTAIRTYLARERFIALRRAAVVLQTRHRAKREGSTQRNNFVAMKSSCVQIQACFRAYVTRKDFNMKRNSAIKVQAWFRTVSAQRKYQALHDAVVVIQRCFRSYVILRDAVRSFRQVRAAALTIQTSYRRYRSRAVYLTLRASAVTIQTQTRGYLQRKRFRQTKQAVMVIERRYIALRRGRVALRSYHIARGAAITIQAGVRGFLVRHELKRQQQAATAIQSVFRGHLTKTRYVKTKSAAVVLQRRYRAVLTGRAEMMMYTRVRIATITIQAGVRGCLVRHELKRQHQAATAIQSVFRGHTAKTRYTKTKSATVVLQRRYRAVLTGRAEMMMYTRLREAAITIQAGVRGCLVRRELRRQHQAATVIQSVFRGHTAKTRYTKTKSAVVVLQRRYRAVLTGRADMMMYTRVRRATITIQAGVRGCLVRRELRRQHRAATVIQSVFRGHTAKTSYTKTKSAAVVLQRRYRAVLTGRADMMMYTRVRIATITIQAGVRGFLVRRELRRQHQAATVIQSVFRGHLAKTRYTKTKSATVVLQRRYRAVLAGRVSLRSYHIARGATITIQAGVRGFLVRRELRRQHRAATAIQSVFRGHTAKTRYTKSKSAVVVLQRRYRAVLAGRVALRSYQIARGAAITIQAGVRGFLVRRELRRQHRAATVIESVFRGHLAMTRYVKTKSATVVLQRRYRAVLAGRVSLRSYHIARGAAITIQAGVRGFLVRRELRRQHRAATAIQSVFRGHLAKTRYTKTKSAVVVLQRRYRAVLLGRAVMLEYTRARQAVVTIQAYCRGQKARAHLRHQNESAVVIQAAYRGFAEKARYVTLKAAAMVLQCRYRAYRAGKEAQESYKSMKTAVIAIQAIYRGMKVREDVRLMAAAAVRIQALYRGHVQRIEYGNVRRATCIIQKHYRAYTNGKRTAQEYQTIRSAVLSLQAVYRGHQVRREIRRQSAAASRIQAVFRGYVQRTEYNKMKRATVVIQSRYRATVTARVEVESYQEIRKAVIKIQAVYRGFVARQELKRLQAIVKIQSVYRGSVARKEFSHSRRCVILLQAKIRRCLAMNRYHKLQAAVVVIQRRWRGNELAREAYIQYHILRGACIVIQSALRGYQAKRNFHALKAATVVLQRRYRATVEGRYQQEEFQRTRAATVIIQAFFRGTKARELVRRHRAARVIQASYRMHTTKMAYARLRSSTVSMQAMIRMKQQKQRFLALRTSTVAVQRRYRATVRANQQTRMYHIVRGAVITIQAAVRGFIVRRVVRDQQDAATIIQTAYRRSITRRRYLAVRTAVLTLQIRYRSFLLGRAVANNYHTIKLSAVVIQSYYRGFQARKEMRRIHAAVQIQAAFKGYIARVRYLKYKSSAIVIQSAVRRYLAQCDYQQLRVAAIFIQRRYRALQLLKTDHVRFLVLKYSAISIQAAVRGWYCRRRYQQLKDATVFAQRKHRANIAATIQRDNYLKLRDACVVLQSAVRSYKARKFAARMRAARVIQSCYRMYTARFEYMKYRNSVVKMQALVRMNLARSEFITLRDAAIIIQTRFRAQIACTRQRDYYISLRRSVILMQSIYLGRKARALVKKRTEERRRQNEAATVIQKIYRGYREMELTRQRYHLIRGAVITIQSRYRGWQARKHVRRILAARTIQTYARALYQGRKARRDYIMVRRAVVVLQAAYRGCCGRREARLHRCARTIQAHVRGFVARRQVKHIKETRRQCLLRFSSAVFHNISAMKIQRYYRRACALAAARRQINSIVSIQLWWRGVLCRRLFLRMRNAAVVLQRTARRRLDIKHNAATRIQAHARVWLMRRKITEMDRAVLRIQALWRGYQVRRHVTSLRVKKARKRIAAANEAATEPMKLCNRARSALDYILCCKNLSTIFDALVNLEVVTRLSYVCCEQLLMDNALRVIFTVIRNSNRSLPHMQIIKYALAVLINVAKCPTTYRGVYEEPDSLSTLLELMTIYREKEHIFSKTCCVLNILGRRDTTIVQDIFNRPKVVEKFQSISYLVERKYKREARRSVVKTKIAKGTPFKNPPPSTPCKQTPFKSHTPYKEKRKSEWAMWQEYVNKVQDPLQAVRSLMKTFKLDSQ